MHRESARQRRRAWTLGLVVGAAFGLNVAVGAAHAMEPAVLLDAELERHAVQFVSLREGRLSYFDAERRLSSANAADYVSLRFARDEQTLAASTPRGGGRLLLADGHDLPGEFAGVDDAGQIIWRHRDLGDLRVTLDDILVMRLRGAAADASEAEETTETEAEARSRQRERRFQPDVHQRIGDDGFDLPAQAAGEPDLDELDELDQTGPERQRHGAADAADPYELLVDGADDRVLLRNGDALTGFIEDVDAEAVHLAMGTNTVPLAWDRVAAVALANPAEPARGNWLVLRDGTRVRVADLAIGSEQVTGEVLGSRALELPAGHVRTVEFAQQHRLVTLAELEPRVAAGGVVFGVPMMPTFARERSTLHAPVTVAVELPSGAKRFTADAVIEDQSLMWADMELIVRDETGEQFRAHLNRDNRRVAVNVPVTGTRLVIELDEAANGPIMDRLQLHDAAILVQQ